LDETSQVYSPASEALASAILKVPSPSEILKKNEVNINSRIEYDSNFIRIYEYDINENF
jgi:hypothetical protein